MVPHYVVAESLPEMSPTPYISNYLGSFDKLRRFPRKVLKVQPDFLWLHSKMQEEKIGGRIIKGARTWWFGKFSPWSSWQKGDCFWKCDRKTWECDCIVNVLLKTQRPKEYLSDTKSFIKRSWVFPTDILNQTRELYEAEEWQLSGLSVGVKMRKDYPKKICGCSFV